VRKQVLTAFLVGTLLAAIIPAVFTKASASTGPTVPIDWWPMFHHDLSHTGYSSSTGPETSDILWVYTTGGPIDIASPIASNGIVYMTSTDGNLYALDAATGAYIWSFFVGIYAHSPAVSDGVVYTGSGQAAGGRLYALDAVTGTPLWDYPTGESAVNTAITVADGMIFFGTGMWRGKIIALDASTHSPVWVRDTSSSHIQSSPAVVDGVVYIGVYWENKVYALKASTGDVIWAYSTGYVVGSSPAVVDGIVYIGSHDHRIHAINAKTGDGIWTYDTGDEICGSPAVADGMVFCGSRTGLYALDAQTGELRWHQDIGNTLSPAVAEGKVYAGSDYGVYCFDETTGDIIWTRATEGDFDSSPAIADGKVFIGCNDGKVYCFGRDTQGPTISDVIVTPNPVAVNTPVAMTADASDSGTGGSNIASAQYSLDGGIFWNPMSAEDGAFDEVTEVVQASFPLATGVYNIVVRATDAAGNTGPTSECILLAVYDPTAGFVTGGGWINSPAGAHAADPSLTGRAMFGFVSKYQKGASVPTGQTEFQFRVADLNFHSTSYEWLVVAGARAQYKGSGIINGAGDYGFMLTAIDGQIIGGGGTDMFRIKIWDKGSGSIIYDNQIGAADTADPTTAIAGGSIVIHKG